MIKTDILIIGSGIGGLCTAIQAAEKRPDLSILLFTKTDERESNTNYAQGGIATVWNKLTDSFEKHIEDTLMAGDGLGDPESIKTVVEEGPERIKEIIEWGVRFDHNKGSDFDLAREGGHSEDRILHYGDLTGREIQRALSEKAKQFPNIQVMQHHFVIDLVTQHHLGYHITRVTPGIECFGAYALDRRTGAIDLCRAKVTVLASGGAGQVYKTTTNPKVATGDGIAMVYRAKGRVANMEFVQFHPTALFDPTGGNPAFLISEAVRGFGGVLKTNDGQTFMEKYDNRESLAPRDIVARAIDREMKLRGEEHVLLDCTHLDRDSFVQHFPNIYKVCQGLGIDPIKDMIPVQPAC
nr:FAD-dependent oxidoreductase [Saprospiraceae bacterium]